MMNIMQDIVNQSGISEERLKKWGLTGQEEVELVYSWDDRPNAAEGENKTYFEEWNVFNKKGKLIGCLYDDGSGYDFAEGYKAGNLDY